MLGSVVCEHEHTHGALRALDSSANLVTHVVPSYELANNAVIEGQTFLFSDHQSYFREC